jgi:hypothetical protein
MLLAAGFVEVFAEFAIVSFHFGQAADQALVLALAGLQFLGQQGQASAEVPEFTIPFLAAGTHMTSTGGNGPGTDCLPGRAKT